jgi:hypothetical protein
MRVYGLNVYEIVLTDALALVGAALAGLGIAAAIVPATLLPGETVGAGLLAGGAIGAGVLLTLAGAGVRQNRAPVDVGLELMGAVAGGWLVWGIVAGEAVPIAIGAVLAATLALLVALRRYSLRARFKPRFFSPRQFETLIAVADTMIDGDGREAIAPVDVAIKTDHLLDDIRSPVTSELKLVLVIVEWVLPLLILRPLTFSALGSQQRRRALERVIGAKGPFRDIARSLKLLACAGYYGHPDTMRAVGFIPFEERDRFTGTDTSGRLHPDPFPGAPPVT